jgi:phage FluMu protein Com
MPRTIQCTECGVVLNLPDAAAGRRLKCPKCGHKFQVAADVTKYPSTEMGSHDASAASSQLGVPAFGPDESRITNYRPGRGDGDETIPTAEGDLRGTFDLPLLGEDPSSSAVPAGVGAGAGAGRGAATGDAALLFEDRKTAPRRKTGAEARAQARRCPTCGGVVPQGMSVCSCGLDLDTGRRVEIDDELMPEAPVRQVAAPIHVIAVGGTFLLGGAIMAMVSAVQWLRGEQGWMYFVPVCLFAVFASVQFLRGKTARLLLVALTLGAMIDVVALIALPVYYANMETTVLERMPTEDDPEAASVRIVSVADRLDSQKLTTGVVILLAYAACTAYLLSPPVRRHFRAAK